MVPAPTAARRQQAASRYLRRRVAWLERERLAVLVPVLFGCLYLAVLRALLSQDGWLALVAGRDIAHHGLPDTEQLTVYAHGVRWVDQQWLAQLAMYGVVRVGGLPLLAVVHVAMAMVVVAIAAAVARRGGAAPPVVLAVALVAFVPLSFVLATVRTQIFGAVAFAVVLALLVGDARRPSARVWAVLPVLALWANLHGSVLLGAALVALRGATMVAAHPRAIRRGAALVLGAALTAVASPYLAHLPEYYRHTAFNPQFGKFVGEWRPATPALSTAPFYLLLFAAAYAFGRRPRALTPFEWLVLVVTGVSGMTAVRNAGWFAMAAIMLLPPAFALTPRRTRRVGSGLPVVGVPLALLVALFAVAAVRAGHWFDSEYPAGPARAVERIVQREPDARIFADVRFADWLLWRDPGLAGRVAFDARYELLTARQIETIRNFNTQRGEGWKRAVAGYRIIVLDERPEGSIAHALLAQPGSKLVYGGKGGTVLTVAQSAQN